MLPSAGYACPPGHHGRRDRSPAPAGRPRVWRTLSMLRALWHVARDDRAWRRLPPGLPPHQTVWSRLMGWRRRAVLDRALRVLATCRRLASGGKRRPTAVIIARWA